MTPPLGFYFFYFIFLNLKWLISILDETAGILMKRNEMWFCNGKHVVGSMSQLPLANPVKQLTFLEVYRLRQN